MDNLTPPTPPEARRITPDCQPEFPCWLYSEAYGYWHWYSREYPKEEQFHYNYTYWWPNQAEAPKEYPTAPTQPPALADRLRLCPVCAKNTVILDGYCGTCRQCTQPPTSLAGGNEVLPSTATADQPPSSHPDYIIDDHGKMIPVAVLNVAMESVSAPAEVAAGCKEGRPVSPATGAREAELREVIFEAADVIRIAYDGRGESQIQMAKNELTNRLLAALTPLLDHLEAELAALRQQVKDLSHSLMKVIEEDRQLVTAKDAEIARLREAQPSITIEQLHEGVTEVICGRDFSFELAKNGTIADLRAQLTAAQTALRESEAARGEDSKRLDWLEEQQGSGLISDDDKHWMVCGDGMQTLPTDTPQDMDIGFYAKKEDWKTTIRAAIDAARAQEERP